MDEPLPKITRDVNVLDSADIEITEPLRKGATGYVHRGRWRTAGAAWRPAVLKMEACDAFKCRAGTDRRRFRARPPLATTRRVLPDERRPRSAHAHTTVLLYTSAGRAPGWQAAG